MITTAGGYYLAQVRDVADVLQRIGYLLHADVVRRAADHVDRLTSELAATKVALDQWQSGRRRFIGMGKIEITRTADVCTDIPESAFPEIINEIGSNRYGLHWVPTTDWIG